MPKDDDVFQTEVQTWTRAEQLRILRAAGFTAHALKGEDLVRAIVMLRRRMRKDSSPIGHQP